MVLLFPYFHCLTYWFTLSVLELVYFHSYLADGGKKDGKFICNIFISHMNVFDPNKTITYIVMFDGALNVHFGSKMMKIHYPKLTVMR